MQKVQKYSPSVFDASGWNIGVVVAKFNSHITDQSLKSVLNYAKKYQIKSDNITVLEVAGSIEIPLALQNLALSGRYRALVAIGCVIRGETAHFDYVCKFVTEGILRVQLDQHIPVGFGVLMCGNEKQALERTSLGGEHLEAALQLAKTIE